ncbi:MAG: ATP-dependent Lon protease [Actinomycetota bacterium]|nr:ATP-dependent Lon protease [Actinomycetota bacterium]
MFPLGTVLFPYASLPLHVFEPRYRVMVRECLRNDHEFGVVLIERGSEVGGGDARFDVGTLARIVRATELDDGRYALMAVGVRRLRVEQWLPEDPFPQANVAVLVEPELPAADVDDARSTSARVGLALEQLFKLWAEVEPRVGDVQVELAGDPQQAAFEAAALAPLGPLDAQRVLEAQSTPARLALLEAMVRDEIELLEARRSR